jgi:hypothetical protein
MQMSSIELKSIESAFIFYYLLLVMMIIVFNKKKNRDEENMHRTCRYDLLIYGIIDICVCMLCMYVCMYVCMQYIYMNESIK